MRRLTILAMILVAASLLRPQSGTSPGSLATLTADWSAIGAQTEGGYGKDINSAGDVNGDGLGDVIVSAPRFDNAHADAGSVWVFFGTPQGLNALPAWNTQGDQAGAYYGSFIGASDLNGDGFSDVLIGAEGYDKGQTDEGRVFAYYGGADGPSPIPGWAVESNRAGTYLGSDGSVGDVNGDGFQGLLLGASRYDNKQTNEGAVYLYAGSAQGPASAPFRILEINRSYAGLGRSVGSGDLNRDGFDDLFAYARLRDDTLFVFHGAPGGPAAKASRTLVGEVVSGYPSSFGTAADAGDVNADGFADLIVGATYYLEAPKYIGQFYIFRGSASSVGTTWDVLVEGEPDTYSGEGLGFAVAARGDYNGDGVSDLAVSSRDSHPVLPYLGRVQVFFGGP